MVARRDIDKIRYKKYALISVYDKKDLLLICTVFKKYKIGIISTGSTTKKIKKLGFSCCNISDVTNFKEILDGRVKTLHPKVHASLLFDRKNIKHKESFKNLNFPIIDFLIVNLYPFEKIISKKKFYQKEIEMIDIGGPALLRSGAKNFNSITSLSSIADYISFKKEMEINHGKTSLKFRKKMAGKIFNLTAKYDQVIANWFDEKTKSLKKIKKYNMVDLRYGENPNQKASIYLKDNKNSIFNSKIHGKEMSYNNILDIDAALNCLTEFTEATCVVIKHNNPCGVASAKNINLAIKKAINADSKSSFGGVVAINRSANIKFAKEYSKKFIEIIIARGFDKNALKIFQNKKNLILINLRNFKISKDAEFKSINDGYLLQKKNLKKINLIDLKQKTNFKLKSSSKNDLLFALKVCKHVKSNAIVLCKNKTTLGIGAGQMNRFDSCKIALMKTDYLKKKKGFVAASDAFFPFIDNIEILIKNNCKSIVQPSGSLNDKKIILYANKKKLPLYFVKNRLFKH